MIDTTSIGPRVGSGTQRIVFEYDDRSVLKYDQYSGQINYREMMRYEDVKKNKPHLLQYLFEVFEGTDDCVHIRMEKAHEVLGVKLFGGYAHYPYVNWLKASEWLETEQGIECLTIAEELDIYDVHPWNIGLREDGSWAFLDYA